MIYMDNITHAITTRRSTQKPQSRAERSPGEDGPIARPVAQPKLLSGPREEHRVLPDDIAAAHDGEPDLPPPPRPDPGS